MLQGKTTPRKRGATITLESVLAMLLGLSVSTGVVYVAQIGNTPVYIGYAVGIIALLVLAFKSPAEVIHSVEKIDRSVAVFCAVVAFSIVPCALYCIAGGLPESALETVLKGFVVLFSGVVVYIVSIALRRYVKLMIAGVSVGLFLNVIFSLIQQRAFSLGSYFSLYEYFPQEAFVLPAQWGVNMPMGAHAIYSFRAQGLFLEPSHMMVFFVAWALIAFVATKGVIPKGILALGVLYCSIQSFSPNLLFILLEVVSLLVITRSAYGTTTKCAPFLEKRLHHASVLSVVVVFAFAVIGLVIFGQSISGAIQQMLSTLGDLDPSTTMDTGTLDRMSAMTSSLSLVLQYPFGGGWNTESIILTSAFGTESFASHSLAIRLLLEVGFVGFAAYLWVMVRHSAAAFRSSDGLLAIAVCLAVVGLAVAQCLNGTTLLPYVWLLLGVAKAMDISVKEKSSER